MLGLEYGSKYVQCSLWQFGQKNRIEAIAPDNGPTWPLQPLEYGQA